MKPLNDVNIIGNSRLITPRELKEEFPVSPAAMETILRGREAIINILERKDSRLLCIVGPCSIHDTEAALEYASRLKELEQRYGDRLCIIMRVYFQKPRTTVGWKGLINDPHLNDSFDVQNGLRISRKLLLDVSEMGLPCGTELLDAIVPQYLADCLSWASIGARTTESPTHREMASGLSMPVGYKNGTDGSLDNAVNAALAAKSPHAFLGIDEDGNISLVRSRGNGHGHIILRGGNKRPNYGREAIQEAKARLVEAGLEPFLVVDCSHANSGKKHERQEVVLFDILNQIAEGEESIVGFMIESNLKEGNQKLSGDPMTLEYGVSITDECISWDTTERLLSEAYQKLRSPAQPVS